MAEDGDVEEKNFNKVQKSSSRSFVTLQLDHWCHMDYFNDDLTTFLGLWTFQLHSCLWRFKKHLDFNKNICICIPKMK